MVRTNQAFSVVLKLADVGVALSCGYAQGVCLGHPMTDVEEVMSEITRVQDASMQLFAEPNYYCHQADYCHG
jgi:hypothetical protein